MTLAGQWAGYHKKSKKQLLRCAFENRDDRDKLDGGVAYLCAL